MLEDVVNVDFEFFVVVVDGCFEFVVDVEGVGDVVDVGVDYDWVGVVVDDLELYVFGEVFGVVENFVVFEGGEDGEGLGVEVGFGVF